MLSDLANSHTHTHTQTHTHTNTHTHTLTNIRRRDNRPAIEKDSVLLASAKKSANQPLCHLLSNRTIFKIRGIDLTAPVWNFKDLD